jgi:hypothetical protein
LKKLKLIGNILLLAFYMLLITSCKKGTTYFIFPDGDDNNPGNSEKFAWQTFKAANKHHFKPGDKILLKGGASFEGQLKIDGDDRSSKEYPILISSTDTIPAIIYAGDSSGLLIENIGNIIIKNLKIEGNGASSKNHGCGIAVVNTLNGNKKLHNIRIENIQASGFARQINVGPLGIQHPAGCGIFVGGFPEDGSKSGYHNVLINHCNTFENQYYGMLITGYWQDNPDKGNYANHNISIENCNFWSNFGDSTYIENHSGSGILLEDVDLGMIQHCKAWQNGQYCKSRAGGPCGIWTAVSNNVTIQYCESYDNRTSYHDGCGFDLDGGCTNNLLQYNYSHDNDGAGFLIYTYNGAPHADSSNVVRYNISENDSKNNPHHAPLRIGNSGSGMKHLEVYDNIFLNKGCAPELIRISGNDIQAKLNDNLFIADAKIPFIIKEKSNSSILFERNNFWSTKNQFNMEWDGLEIMDISRFNRLLNVEPGNFNSAKKLEGISLSNFEKYGSASHPKRLEAFSEKLDF